MTQMTRRQTLELCALSFLAVQAGCADERQLTETSRQTLNTYATRLKHLKDCRSVGRAWLDTQSEPFNPVDAYHSLFSTVKDPTDLKALQGVLKDNCTNDFEAGRIINHEGWLLSQTEVTLYALLTHV